MTQETGTDRTTTAPTIAGRPPLVGLVLLVALVAALAIALFQAGRSGADPQEVSDLADTYTSSENPLGVPLTEDQARCRARVYLGSKLSEGALDDVREGRQPRARNDRDVAELNRLTTKLADCL